MVVAFVPVAFVNVKFWRVVEPVSRTSASDEEEVAVSEPTARLPTVDDEINELTARKMLAKKLVVVAFVPVAFTNVKF